MGVYNRRDRMFSNVVGHSLVTQQMNQDQNTVEHLHDRDRLLSLAETGLLDTPQRQSLDRYTRIATRALKAPVSLVSLVSDERQVFAGSQGLDEPWETRRETPLSHSFCQYVVNERSALVVNDARNNALVCDNLAINELNVAAYAGVPLCDRNGNVLGSLCVIDHRPRQWQPVELELLRLIAEEVTNEIELARRAWLAETAEKALSEVNEEIAAAHPRAAEHNAAVMHDLRTPLQVVYAAARTLSEQPSIQNSATLTKTVDMLQRNVQQVIKLVKADGQRYSDDDLFQHINVADLVERVCEDLAMDRSMGVDFSLEPAYVLADAMMIQRAVQNLFSNALRFAAGRIIVEDDGDGLPCEDDYQQAWELGRRFHTDRSNTGLGLTVTRQLIQALGGVVQAGPSEWGGARFELILPQASQSPQLPPD